MSQNKWFYLCLLSFIWGSSYILIKYGLIGLTPLQLGSVRIIISCFFLLIVGYNSISNLTYYDFINCDEAKIEKADFYKHAENRQDDTTKPLVHFHMGEERPASKESQYEANGSILWSLTHKLFKNRKPFSASK